jgi:hypothetical protein
MTRLLDYIEFEILPADGIGLQGTGYAIARCMLLYSLHENSHRGKELMYKIIDKSGLDLVAVDHYHHGNGVIATYFFQGDQEATLSALRSTLQTPEFAQYAAQIAQELGISLSPSDS